MSKARGISFTEIPFDQLEHIYHAVKLYRDDIWPPEERQVVDDLLKRIESYLRDERIFFDLVREG